MKKNTIAKLTEGNVPKQLLLLTLPMIVGVLGMVVFNLADTFFVSKLGADQLAALSFTFPVVMIINSLSSGLGIGSSALISRYVGKKEHYKVERLATDSLRLGLLLSLLTAILGYLTITPLFSFLGAEGAILDYIKEYMTIWYFGVVMIVVPMIGNNIIRALGDTKIPGLVMGIAALTNIILDPLLIFGIGPLPQLNIKGAALATVIARGVTTIVAVYVLSFREGIINFKLAKVQEIVISWKEVLYIGIPNSLMRMLLPIGSGIITKLLSAYGPAIVAGFGVATKIEFFALAFSMALVSAMGPFIGQNLGAQKFDRVVLGIKIGEIFALIPGIILVIVFVVFAKSIARLFSAEPQIIDTIVLYLRVVPIAYGLQGILQIGSTVLNVLNKPFHASGLMIVQIFVLYVPFAVLGSKLFGVIGVFASLSLSYLISGMLAHFEMKRQVAKYMLNIQEAK